MTRAGLVALLLAVTAACAPEDHTNLDELDYVPPAIEYAWERCLTGDLSADKRSIHFAITTADANRPPPSTQIMNDAEGAVCALEALNAPSEVVTEFANTERGDGSHRATWDDKTTRWTFTAAGAMDLTITSEPGP